MTLYRLTGPPQKTECSRAVRIKRWWRLQQLRLLRETATAKKAGLGFALGAFIGIMPSSVGVDAPMAFCIARYLNWAPRTAALGTFVMNPFTAPFFYGLGAYVGASIFHRNIQSLGWQQMMSAPGQFGIALLLGCTVVSVTFASVLGCGVYFWLCAKRPARTQQ